MPTDWIAAFAELHHLSAETADELEALFLRQLALQAPTELPPEAGDARPELPAHPDWIAGRYRDLGPLGEGGMGEVRRVYDTRLERSLAMKLVHPRLLPERRRVQRFVAEAQATAQLQHPGIVPVHDLGFLPDGRAWFTMREVDGPTLAQAIADGQWTLRRLVTAFVTVCRTVAYAHDRGVVHRDLKPANVIVGSHGEVLVLDWGIAKVVGTTSVEATQAPSTAPDPVTTDWSLSDGTVAGSVVGTPAYMAPEQADGTGPVDARADVYALGAMLHHVLSGAPPAAGPLPNATPEELVAICTRATALDPADRFSGAADLAHAVEAWLDGVRRTEQALEQVARATEASQAALQLQAEARARSSEGAALLQGVAGWQPAEDKAPGWALQDEAAELERRAALRQLEASQGLHAALRMVPALAEAHLLLLQRALARHERAERSRDVDEMLLAQGVAREHAAALPDEHPARVGCATYLRGDGALTLHPDPPGAEVMLFRYEVRNRRLVPQPVRGLGRTPLQTVPLPMGRYLAVIQHPERAEVRVPFEVARGAHWDGVPPGESDSLPVWLPRPEDLGPDDVYVPAGWFRSGGDPTVFYPLPDRRLWCHAMVFERFPVTTRRYVAFLDALVARGDEDLAELLAPRPNGARVEDVGPLLFPRGPDGRFQYPHDGQVGTQWLPEFPITIIDWHGAKAYAAWRAEQTGRPWRLPGELEWEHAARGPDGRLWPWGDAFDPSWCVCRDGHRGKPLPHVIDTHPVDVSPYGVRGMAGNMREWCGEVFGEAGPPVVDGRVAPPPDEEGVEPRVARGGSWSDNIAHRCGFRIGHDPRARNPFMSVRLARAVTAR